MTSVLSVASSSSSPSHYSSAASNNSVPPSPSIHSHRSALSSRSSLLDGSLEKDDDENVTITSNRLAGATASTSSSPKEHHKDQSNDDLRLLAISTHITELSYAISDIQTRIFEIQELRHKSQSQSHSSDTSSPSSKDTNVSNIIDQSLMSLDERLESVEKGIKAVAENIEPYTSPTAPTPTTANTVTQFSAPTPTATNSSFPSGHSAEVAALLRKHAALLQDWEAVQDESDVLREELKEDKWLTVFRTVTDQADGMMSSLEKAVNRCQDFIYQVHNPRPGITSEEFFSSSSSPERPQVNLDTFHSLLESYEAKKKHYMPATSKVLAIIDRGVRDRVTKNGETLRRHSESAQRWKTLRDRIARTDAELEKVRKILLNSDSTGSENDSSTSGTNPSTGRTGYLATPPNSQRSKLEKAEKGGLSRSISPFRKFARKITGSGRSSNAGATPASPNTPAVVSPLSVTKKTKSPPVAATVSAPPTQTLRRQRTSLFATVKSHDPHTPERPGHKHSMSVTPESSPRVMDTAASVTKTFSGYSTTMGKSRTSLSTTGTPSSSKPSWNSSTKVEDERKITTRTPGRTSRPPSATGMYKSFSSMGTGNDVPPVPPLNPTGTPYRRSVSRASVTSSRPWSPLGSSTSHSSSAQNGLPISVTSSAGSYSNGYRAGSRPPSRAQTPSRMVSNSTALSMATTPRARPKTPSHIPGPGKSRSISSSAAVRSSDWSPGDMYSPENYNRALSPTFSVSGQSASGHVTHPPRPPSRSMIPIPSVHLSATSPGARSTSSMSHVPGGYAYNRSGAESPTLRMAQFKANARRSQTPDLLMMSPSASGSSSRNKAPPSSFRDGSANGTPSSRPSSRAGAHTPSFSMFDNSSKLSLSGDAGNFGFEYVVGNPHDPLDVEVGKVVNSIPHGMIIERVDPPLKKPPKAGEEVKAQYAFSSALGRKVITCRLTTLTRATRVPATEGEDGADGGKARVTMVTTKKVMCRVGGGKLV
ncbi:hypothetical protein CC1G_00888 [Coprinopsis cinerea okayama7|uniref:GAR domain-containing protein n=1 Tax=Coprinopsis cinerea (strain Okayama-7 / 130 / ATCC MYA-4618 / FGSC 9003) TaxID=240176 RepID=A8N913_COPC7|nr:hypothetical protein CC1G_00888 [Coprinopsis cinerea okayama7\|eukprot:XP_001831341.2 hypothetical protein CC1G_00888 [Coprinopsis cinerea okayama7\